MDDTTGNHSSFFHRCEAARAPSPSLLPHHGELFVSIRAIDGVDADGGKSGADFHG